MNIEQLQATFTEEKLIKMTKEIIEKAPKITASENYTVSGIMELLGTLLEKGMQCASIPLKEIFYLLSEVYLFGKYDESTKSMCIDTTCKHPLSRKKALILLEQIIKRLKNENEIAALLIHLYDNPTWRTEKKTDWSISAPKISKPKGNNVGLVNMGATCFANSVIQQLYMIKHFRYSILGLEEDFHDKAVVMETQKAFGVLEEKLYSSYPLKGLMEAMKIDVNSQKDVAEFIATLFEYLQEGLKNTKQANVIKETFEFNVANEIACKECKTNRENVCSSLLLSLEVKGKADITESLISYIKSEILEKDNAYQCDNCAKKVTAEKREILKTLPNILLVHLKRFELDFDGGNSKVNNYFEFPENLDLEAFTKPPRFKDNPSADLGKNEPKTLPKSYYRYKLRGIIVHSGSINHGHYYSFIKDSEKSEDYWLEFNDEVIRKFDLKDLKEETFGDKGDKTSTDGIPPEALMKTNNAYVLFYERELILPPHTLMQIECDSGIADHQKILAEFEELKTLSNQKIKHSLPPNILKLLWQDRTLNYIKDFVFQPEYIKFAAKLMQFSETQKVNSGELPIIIHFAILFFFTTAVRSEMKEEMYIASGYIKKLCENNLNIAEQIVGTFSHPATLREFLVDCPIVESRKAVVGILKVAIKTLFEKEKDVSQHLNQLLSLQQKDKNENLEEKRYPPIVYLFFATIKEIDNLNLGNCGQYFEILTYFAKLSPEIKSVLNSMFLLGVCFELIGVSKIKNWRKNCAQKAILLKSPCWSFVEPNRKDIIKAEAKSISSQVAFVYELLLELISDETLQVEYEEIANLAEESSIKSILKQVSNSRLLLNLYSKILLSLCTIKKGIYANTIVNALGKLFSNCANSDMKNIIRPIIILLSTKDPTLFEVLKIS